MKTYGYRNRPKSIGHFPADVIVIGGTSGIGESICERLSEANSDYPCRVVAYGIEDFQAQQVYWEGVFGRHDYPTEIVYSAGENKLRWLGGEQYTHNEAKYECRDMFSTNVIGFIDMLDGAARAYDLDGPKPSIVAISSDAGTRPLRTSISYCASKAALDMAVRVAARELGPDGWRVNAVAPGMVANTAMSDYIDKAVPIVRSWTPEKAAEYERSQEVVPGRVERWMVADVVEYLLRAPSHVNGVILPVNGGR